MKTRGAAGAIGASGAGAIGRVKAPRRAREGRDHPRGRNLPDRMVPSVRDVDIADCVGGNAIRPGESCRSASAVRTSGVGSGACDGGDHAGRCDFADEVDISVGHVEIAGRTDRDAIRELKTRVAAGAIGPAQVSRRASKGGDNTRRRDLADEGILRISDEEAAGRIDRNSAGGIEPCGGTDSIRASDALEG